MNNIIYYYPGLKNPDDDNKEEIKEDRRIESIVLWIYCLGQIKHGSDRKIFKDFLYDFR